MVVLTVDVGDVTDLSFGRFRVLAVGVGSRCRVIIVAVRVELGLPLGCHVIFQHIL